MNTESTVRRKLHFRGRVQGVGFRQTARGIADRFAVTGFVENLSDGRVLLVAEGAAAEVEAFTAAVGSEMQRWIAGVEQESTPATGEFARFTIRR